MEAKIHGSLQYAKTVDHASPEIDRRRLREILRRTADLAHAEAEPEDLGEHLVVEDEVVGVLEQRKRFQHLAREGPVAGVVLGELRAEQEVLERGQEAVRDVLVERHAALEGAGPQDARAEHHVEWP